MNNQIGLNMSNNINVFYSWQSDLENKYNRGFIKGALEKAIKTVNANLEIQESEREVEVELDHDTKNVPGTPDLAGTIFEKIASSTVFIADISFVATLMDNSGQVVRKVANPNVLIELGYALSTLGSDRVLCVFNTAHGSVNDLPFDLKHKRHPIQYQLDDTTNTKAKQKETLVASLEKGIELIVDLEKYTEKKSALPSSPSQQEIFEAIISSDSKEDWRSSSAENSETRYFKNNVNLRFTMSVGEDGIQRKDFQAEWANKFPDPSATGYWHHLYFGSTLIDSFILVSVDGARAILPIPENNSTLVVSPLYYKVAQIHDTLGTFDQYVTRAGLKIRNFN